MRRPFTSTRSPRVKLPATTPSAASSISAGDRGGDDQALPDVEQAERGLAAGRGILVLAQVLVVALRLELLAAEVLHGLVVQQAVDRARAGARVGSFARRRISIRHSVMSTVNRM